MSEATDRMDLAFRAIVDKAPLVDFVMRRWGTSGMLIGMHRYDVKDLEATGLYLGDELVAFANWTQRDRMILICAVHSLRSGEGFARQLLEELKRLARARGATVLRAMASNDNLPALAFFQLNGFRLTTLYVGAIDAFRGAMPGLISKGYRGIDVRDAIELEFLL
ncbi:MAG TPA: GNAT family N-acetyltransferase [Beijerinckiaceae bacterium]|nr:GNAT family N-acetyltransferase [Beijerinckiaceae bacterium]